MSETVITEGQASAGEQSSTVDSGAGIVSDGGRWFEQLPAEIRAEKMFEPFKGKGVGDLAKSYIEKERMLGSSIRIPGEKDTPEDRKSKTEDIYNKMGRPLKPEDYKLEYPELPPALEWDAAKQGEFKKFVHGLGLSTAQAQELVKFYANEVKGLSPDQEVVSRDTRAKLVEEVGEPMYKRMIGHAYKAALHYGGKEYIDHLNTSGRGSDEWTIRILSKAGRDLAEHGVVEPESFANGQVSTSEGAKAKIAEIMNDKESPYHSRNKAGHDEVLEEMQRLFRIAYDGE